MLRTRRDGRGGCVRRGASHHKPWRSRRRRQSQQPFSLTSTLRRTRARRVSMSTPSQSAIAPGRLQPSPGSIGSGSPPVFARWLLDADGAPQPVAFAAVASSAHRLAVGPVATVDAGHPVPEVPCAACRDPLAASALVVAALAATGAASSAGAGELGGPVGAASSVVSPVLRLGHRLRLSEYRAKCQCSRQR